MKPTVQTLRPARRGESQRPAAHSVISSPVTDWSFQPGSANLVSHGTFLPGAANSAAGFRGLSQAFFDAESKRSYRAEAGVFVAMIALAVWPIAQAAHAAFALLK
ncbi:MAG: hypothetical protein M3Y69_10440 [Verrucomicrobiota bacterium]|nr:hypothetical protein [Verrucomicrobiota bacterium]